MGLVEGSGEAGVIKTCGDVVKGGDGRHEDAEVGHGEAEQVHVHHSCVKGKYMRVVHGGRFKCIHRNVDLIM